MRPEDVIPSKLTSASPLPQFAAAQPHRGGATWEQRRKLELIFRQVRFGAPFNLLGVILAAFLLAKVSPQAGPGYGRSLFAWAILGVFVEWARLASIRHFKRDHTRHPYRYWSQLHHSLTVLSALHFAYLSIMLFPSDNPAAQIIVVILVVGSVALCAWMNVASPTALALFAYGTTLPLAAQFGMAGQPADIGAAAMLCILAVGASTACDEVAAIFNKNLALTKAFHDKVFHDLTHSLLPHDAFLAQLNAAALASQSSGDNVSILLIDLDGFSQFNQRRSADEGDRALRLIGSAIRSTIRRADIAGRIGADEFAILLTPANPQGSTVVAENIRRAIRHLEIGTGELGTTLTASIGVACSTHGEVEPRQLLADAARACHLAKQRGPGSIHLLNTSADHSARPDAIPRRFRLLGDA